MSAGEGGKLKAGLLKVGHSLQASESLGVLC